METLVPCSPSHPPLQVLTLLQKPELEKDAGGPKPLPARGQTPLQAQTTDSENKVELYENISPVRNTCFSEVENPLTPGCSQKDSEPT